MSYARLITGLGLAVIVISFAATWLTVPVDALSDQDISPPASLFLIGLGTRDYGCERYSSIAPRDTGGRAIFTCLKRTDHIVVNLSLRELRSLKTRIVVIFLSAAAVLVLLGLTFGAARGTKSPAGSD